ncbi:hypothetical protein LTR56_019617 [Elasticomyces elasticus]|nr:hypothetical protein LTR56_019617 [Elasticomyces elasticus]KAK3634449.1 hypothetical protein LTR22_019608 [Elasticomyces elasticus]KAK4917055.1 hypothetical protein LTR49_014958 [Elasticomyces elasticus]KAK5750725.1 hypothetical protein LTS12_019170 [Elasticomyces elasticus]
MAIVYELVVETIEYVKTAIVIWEATKDKHKVPRQLRVIAAKLPAIQELLELAEQQCQVTSLPVPQWARVKPSVGRCRTHCKDIRSIFIRAFPLNANAAHRAWTGTLTVTRGKKVEQLLQDVYGELQVLNQHHITTNRELLAQIGAAVEELVSAEDLTYHHSGPGELTVMEFWGQGERSTKSGSRNMFTSHSPSYVQSSEASSPGTILSNHAPPPPQQPYPQGQNPFMPNANVAVPGQFNQPLWQDDQQQYRPRAYTPAADHKRSISAHRLRKLETDVESMRRKVNDWDLSSGESSEGRDRDAIFTDPRAGYPESLASYNSDPSQIAMGLEDAIASSNIDTVQTTLDKHFEDAATGPWSWLSELKNLGYTNHDIAEMLLERHRERPWIQFDPWILNRSLPDPHSHIGHCVHQYEHFVEDELVPGLEEARTTGDDVRSMRSAVASLCGLGGVVPSTGTTPESWQLVVKFSDDSSAAIGYDTPDLGSTALLDHLIKAMEAFCTALDVVQRANGCCDAFTVLVTPDSLEGEKSKFAELRLVPVVLAMEFLRRLKAASLDGKADKADLLARCDSSAQDILGTVEPPYSLVAVYHRCALAVQFLTIGLVSYCQAHVAGLEMFFLEQKLTSVQLGGVSRPSHHGQSPKTIHLSMQRLTCLDGMLGSPVMVFTRSDRLASLSERLDVKASAEALLDTWGPGGMVMEDQGDYKVVAMSTLRGGNIYSTDGRYLLHWSSNEQEGVNTIESGFDPRRKYLIGAVVEVNPACSCTEQECLAKGQSHYLPLGTMPSHMRQHGIEYGLAGGQYAMITLNNVLEKVPGVSLKEVVLDRLQRGQDYLNFLTSSYGLQVSFCSGLARRVRMRDLLAELLPTFVQRNAVPIRSWTKLKDHYHITDLLARGDIRDVLQLMYIDDPICYQDFWLLTLGLTRSLKETGLNLSKNTFDVAIIPSTGEEPLRRISFDAGRDHYWTRALRDTETCATFAYFTLSCLQVGGLGCRSKEQNWHREVLLLETEVLRSLSGHPHSNVPETWVLEHGKKYRLGSPDADARFSLLAEVIRRRPTEDPQLFVQETLSPAWVWKRLQQKRHIHLQERQGPSDVVVKAFMTSIDTARFSFA